MKKKLRFAWRVEGKFRECIDREVGVENVFRRRVWLIGLNVRKSMSNIRIRKRFSDIVGVSD